MRFGAASPPIPLKSEVSMRFSTRMLGALAIAVVLFGGGSSTVQGAEADESFEATPIYGENDVVIAHRCRGACPGEESLCCHVG